MAERRMEKAFVDEGGAGVSGFGPEPAAADLALINDRFALEALAPEAVYVRRMVLANDAVDRSFERFPKGVLERFAQTLPGKPVLVAHEKGALPIGLIYRAQVRPARGNEAGDTVLAAALYMVKSPANAEVRQQIDAGVVRSVSIGFRYDQRFCSVCGQDYFDCPHQPGATTGDGQAVTYTYGGDLARYEACECSLVYLGCQQQAGITKAAGDREQGTGDREGVASQRSDRAAGASALSPVPCSLSPEGGTSMDHEKALARVSALEAEIKVLTEQVAQRDAALAEAPGEGDSKAPGAALIADGKAYRQHLRAEVKRLAGILKSEAEASLLLSALPHAPAAALAELVDSYRARVEEKFPPRGVGELAAAPGASLSPGDPRPAPVGPERPFRFS